MSTHPDDAKAADVFVTEQEKPFNLQSMDARDWATEWLRVIKDHPDIPTDEGTMIGWFANAIMAGYDEAQRRSAKENAALRARIARAREILETARKEVLKRRRNARSYIEIVFAVVEMRLGENVVDDSAERGALDALKELGE